MARKQCDIPLDKQEARTLASFIFQEASFKEETERIPLPSELSDLIY